MRLEDYVPAPISGIYEPTAEPGDFVDWATWSAGSTTSIMRRAPVEMRAPRSGWLLVAPFAAAVEKGQTVLVVAEEVPL